MLNQRVSFTLLFSLLFCIHLSAQHAILNKDGNKKYSGGGEFHVFANEILLRGDSGICKLPDGSKVMLGYGGDIGRITNFKELDSLKASKAIKRQSVFLESGKLEGGYLVDLSFLRDSIGNDDIIKIANNQKAVVQLKKGSEETQKRFPYAELQYFISSSDFQKYIRIIVPGHVTFFLDKGSIETSPNTFDDEQFKKYEYQDEEGKVGTLLLKVDSSALYKVRPDFKLIRNVSVNSEEEFILSGGERRVFAQNNLFTLGPVLSKPLYEQLWFVITAIVLLGGIIGFGIWFLLKSRSKTSSDVDATASGVQGTFKARSTPADGDVEELLKDLRASMDANFERIGNGQSNLKSSIENLEKQNESGNSQRLEELNKKNAKLSSQLQNLQKEKESLAQSIQQNETKYQATTSTLKGEISSLEESVNRYASHISFISNYESLNNFYRLFTQIESLEKETLKSIGKISQSHLRSTAMLLFAKYQKNHAYKNFEKWAYDLQLLSNGKGLIVNPDVIRKLNEKEENAEKIKLISWIVKYECLMPKLNVLLILLEEFRNLDKITDSTIPPQIVEIGKQKGDILNSMRQGLKIEVDDIRMFDSFNNYKNIKTESNTGTSFSIPGVDKYSMGDILEIKSYGMVTQNRSIDTIVVVK